LISVQNPYFPGIEKLVPPVVQNARIKFLLKRQREYISRIKFDPRRVLFTKVLIETTSTCNNNCGFCPVPQSFRDRGILSNDLLMVILDQLKSLNWRGKIALFNNNEPFTDENIIEKIKLARIKLPMAYHYLLTNGSHLTFKKMRQIESIGLDKLVINNYNDALTLNQQLRTCLKEVRTHSWKPKLNIKIVLRKKNEILTSRGGRSPNKKLERNPFSDSICLYPFFQLNINWKGEVFLCCSDVNWELVLGNIKKNTLFEIWTGSAYGNMREILTSVGRKGISLCCGCDFFVKKTIR
jgi:MoaA/NifB/PqqE/SkfB family radical SAM enzyme